MRLITSQVLVMSNVMEPRLQLAIPEELYAPMGRVAANFAAVEGCIDFAIWTLIGGDQSVARAMTNDLRATLKIECLKKEYKKKLPRALQEQQAIGHLCDALHKARIKRDQVMHAQWGTGGIMFPMRGIDGQKMHADDILKIADQIAIVGTQVQSFLYTNIIKKII